MLIDFSKIDGRERPTLVLRSMDGSAIQTLGYAFHIELEPNYNEISTLSFDVPAHIDDARVPGYEKIVGMQIIDMVGVGQFIVNNPDITETAVKGIKSAKAYSLEYEFTFKKLTLTNSTYNFWNPAQPDNTILGIILEKMPSWGVGTVDETLIGKYRTYEVTNQNLYDFMKGTLQESYGCVFEFDTIHRLINVRDVSSQASVQPVYVSLKNLAKEISITEETENIFTCLDVNGAEGIDIRSVNPTGTNTIYDLGYFMTTDNFSQEMIDKWNNWVQGVESRRQEYYNLTVENALLHMQIATENAALGTLQGELKALEAQMVVEIEAAAQGIETNLSSISEQVNAKKNEIAAKEAYIATLNQSLETSQNGLIAVNNACKWSAYGITAEEEKLLNRYIKEDAIEDSSFVAPVVDSYVATGNSFPATNVTVSLSGSSISGSPLSSGKMVYAARGGTAAVTVNGEVKLSAILVQGAFDRLSGKGTICLYTEKGCATISGAYSLSTDCMPDKVIGGSAVFGSTASISSSSADVYITTQLTEYSQKAVAWDLYEYGREVLHRLAYPSYTFSVDSGNFLAMEEFDTFRRNLRLGDKLYLNLGKDFGVLQPVLVGARINFEDKKLSLVFSNSFSLADSAFKLADLLDKSVSMGKSVDLKKYSYNAFANAGGTSGVQQLMNTMTDLALTQIKSSGKQAWTLDDAGFRMRKYADETHATYDPKQIWMSNNMLAFTKDNWATASMALGYFNDKNLGEIYGMVAPSIVGTLLAGSNLVIESAKQSGGVSVFKVDADGAKLYNSQFDLANEYSIDGVTKVGQISLNPSIGIVAGSLSKENAFYSYDTKGNIVGIKATDGSSLLSVADIGKKTPLSNFWVDNHGNVYLKGSVYADNGVFRGTVYATDGEFTGKVTATSGKFQGTVQASDFLDGSGKSMLENGKWSQKHLNIKSLNINNKFMVDENGFTTILSDGNESANVINLNSGKFVVDAQGNVTMKGNINMSEGTITWDSTPVKYQYAKALDENGNPLQIFTSYTVGCIYRRESFDNQTWGPWYQFIGQNGINGENGKDGREVQYLYASTNPDNESSWHSDRRSDDKYRKERLGDDGEWGPWYQFKGTDGTPGVSNYFHIKYSNDGKTFTDNDGEVLGTWMGTCVTESLADPTEFSEYEWRKIVGEDGESIVGPEGSDGSSCFFFVKFSPFPGGRDPANHERVVMYEDPDDAPEGTIIKYMGTCSVTMVVKDGIGMPKAPDNPDEYTWALCRGEDGENGVNGVSVASIVTQQSTTSGGTNTIVVTLTDGTTAEFQVQNGRDGQNGENGKQVRYQYSADMKNWHDIYDAGNDIYRRESFDGQIWDTGYQFIGQNGTNGAPGTSTYFHVRYSNDGGKSFTANQGETLGDYIGTYVDHIEADSDNVNDYKWSKINAMDGDEGTDGKSTYFYVKFSPNPNGIPMYESPEQTTEEIKYMGVCSVTFESTEMPKAPESASAYTWTKCKGENGADGRQVQYQYSSDGVRWHNDYNDGSNGTAADKYRRESFDGKTWGAGYQFVAADGHPGDNGSSSYLHIKYSNDGGANFTDPNGNPPGEILGDYIGIYVDDSPIDADDPDYYEWKRIKGEVGANGDSCYFHVKFSPSANGKYGNRPMMYDTPEDAVKNGIDEADVKYMGVCSSSSPDAPTNPDEYTWTKCRGDDGQNGKDASVTHATMLAAAKEAFDSGKESWIAADEAGFPVIYGGTIYGAEFHGNKFNIYPGDVSSPHRASGSMSMYGWWGSNWLEVFKLRYVASNVPVVEFSSPCSAEAAWEFDSTEFSGACKFSGRWVDFCSVDSIDGIYGYGKDDPQTWQEFEENYGTAFGDNNGPRDGFIYFQIV